MHVEKPILLWVPGTVKPCPRARSYIKPSPLIPRSPGDRLRLCYAHKCHTIGTASAGDDSEWRQAVQAAASKYGCLTKPFYPKNEPLFIGIVAMFARPLGHYTARDPLRGLRADAPPAHSRPTMPDNDNLEKAIWDALGATTAFPAGLLWANDEQITQNWTLKRFADTPEQAGALIITAPVAGHSPQYLIGLFDYPRAKSYLCAGSGAVRPDR